jgi:hypothetical protein
LAMRGFLRPVRSSSHIFAETSGKAGNDHDQSQAYSY